MKLEEQLDRTVCSWLCRSWSPTPNHGWAQWLAKKTEDHFFLLIHPRIFLSYAGFYSSSSWDHVANTFQGTASEMQLAHFSSGATSLWFPTDVVHQAGGLNCLVSSLVFWIHATLPLWPWYWLTVTASLQLIYCRRWLLPGRITKSAFIPEEKITINVATFHF